MTHICVSKLTIIGSVNGLSPGRHQAIIWTNAGILLIRPLGTNFNETLIEILTFSFLKMRLKVSSAKWRPFCLGLNVLSYRSCYLIWVHDGVIKWKHFPRYWSFVCVGNSLVTGEFPSQRPVTRSFNIFFDLTLNKRLSKQSIRPWFETPSGSLWRHCNVFMTYSNCLETYCTYMSVCFCELLCL